MVVRLFTYTSDLSNIVHQVASTHKRSHLYVFFCLVSCLCSLKGHVVSRHRVLTVLMTFRDAFAVDVFARLHAVQGCKFAVPVDPGTRTSIHRCVTNQARLHRILETFILDYVKLSTTQLSERDCARSTG